MRRLALTLTLLGVSGCAGVEPTTPDAPDQSPVTTSSPGLEAWGESSAPANRITRGDVEAVLDAFGTAGYLIVARNGWVPVPAAPADYNGDKGSIRPLPFLDGHHYCTLDWLVPVLAIFFYDDVGSPQEIRAALDSTSVALFIDGQPFATRRTPVMPWNAQRYLYGVNAFGYQVGEVVAPGTFSLGAHTLLGVAYYADSELGRGMITFYIDDATSATCTG